MIHIYLNIFILSWLITHFSPLKMLVETIPYKKLNPVVSILMSVTILQIYCMMCCSFWTGLIMTGDIFTSAWASLIGYLWGHIENKIEYTKL